MGPTKADSKARRRSTDIFLILEERGEIGDSVRSPVGEP